MTSVDTAGYDLVVSRSRRFAEMVRVRCPTARVCYCYSPARYLWGMTNTYPDVATGAQRAALAVGVRALRWLDRRAAAGVDRFIRISRHVAQRSRRAYGRPADVVYPPVAPKRSAPPASERGAFVLHLRTSRTSRPVQAGGGLAGRLTCFLGPVSEEEAARSVSSCAACVHAAEDDFGIAPLEANAHGAPVAGFARGGLAETVIAGGTAELFEEQSIDAVAEALRRALARRWDVARARENAARFASEWFGEAFGDSILRRLHAARSRTRM